MTARPIRIALRFVAAVLLLAYVGATMWLLTTDDGWAVNRLNVAIWSATVGPAGLRLPITPEQFADIANVLLFIPPFLALGLLVPSWWWVLLGGATSCAVELYQRSEGSRDASAADVVTNTLGAAIGVGLGLWISRAADRRAADDGPVHPHHGAPHDRTDPPTPGPDPHVSASGPVGAPDGRG